MVRTYQEIGEKEYYRTYITIDGVTIPDVGIRLKGNLTLKQTLGGSGNGQLPEGRKGGSGAGGFPGMPDAETVDLNNLNLPPFIELPENWETLTEEEKREELKNLLENMEMPGLTGGKGFGKRGADGEDGEEENGNPPYLVKFDEFTPGQTYQGLAELAIRLGSDKSLLGEPTAFTLHKEMGQIAPETAYAIVDIAENEHSLYVIAEHLDNRYIEKYFPDEDGILYKAGNFVALEYKGEDPSLYTESFEQKTNKGDDDMAQLIAFFKFISESSDEEFEKEIGDWIDIDSMVQMMVLDNLLQNNDSFVGMGSNYYLFYSKTKEIFTLLTWDQNLALGGMGNMMGRGKEGEEITESEKGQQDAMNKWLEDGGMGEDGKPGRDGPGNGKNLLKERFMANENLKALYDAQYKQIKEKIFTKGLGLQVIERFSIPFLEYNEENNIVDQEEYEKQLKKMKEFFE